MNRVDQALFWLTVALPLFAMLLARADEDEKSLPIVDVRFDGPYRQVESSIGDEWAPSWGRDDVLYTSNDDGTSFGGIVTNALAFGKLKGSDPQALKGSTVSSMRDFREPGTLWKPLKSANGAHPELPRVLPGFGNPVLVELDKASAALMGNDEDRYLHVAVAEGTIAGESAYVLGRTPKSGGSENQHTWLFLHHGGTWTDDLAGALRLTNTPLVGPDGANWKAMNTYAVDGVLYMFVTRCLYPTGSPDPERRHYWKDASIIKSTDGGETWTRPATQNFDHPMFPGRTFATPYFVWYGKDGAASVDNADKYVYAVSNNGFFENGDYYILGRVLKSKLPLLSSADWSFHRGGDGFDDGSWTPSADAAKPILVNTRHSSMTGMTYIRALGRYVMVVWHYHAINFEQGIKDHDLGTVLEFYEAGKPWGPWTKIKSFDTGTLGWYTPIVGQRFQTKLDVSSAQAFLYATGFFTRPEGGLDMSLYKLDYIPITLSTKPLQHKDPAYAGGR